MFWIPTVADWQRRRNMSATETKGMALIAGASAGSGAIRAAAKVASPLATIRLPRWPLASLASAAPAENALVSGPILPALLRLTLPNLAAMLVLALVAIFETVYVGILTMIAVN
jgi:hypothetical protein